MPCNAAVARRSGIEAGAFKYLLYMKLVLCFGLVRIQTIPMLWKAGAMTIDKSFIMPAILKLFAICTARPAPIW